MIHPVIDRLLLLPVEVGAIFKTALISDIINLKISVR